MPSSAKRRGPLPPDARRARRRGAQRLLRRRGQRPPQRRGQHLRHYGGLALSADGNPRFEYRMDGFDAGDHSRCCDAVSYYPHATHLAQRGDPRWRSWPNRPPASIPSCGSAASSAPPRDENRRIRIEARGRLRQPLAARIRHSRPRRKRFRAEADSAAVGPAAPKRTGFGPPAGRDLTARIPAGALYEPVFCRAEQLPRPGVRFARSSILTSGYRILPVTETPLHRAMTVSVRAFVPEDLQSPHGAGRPATAKGTASPA